MMRSPLFFLLSFFLISGLLETFSWPEHFFMGRPDLFFLGFWMAIVHRGFEISIPFCFLITIWKDMLKHDLFGSYALCLLCFLYFFRLLQSFFNRLSFHYQLLLVFSCSWVLSMMQSKIQGAIGQPFGDAFFSFKEALGTSVFYIFFQLFSSPASHPASIRSDERTIKL